MTLNEVLNALGLTTRERTPAEDDRPWNWDKEILDFGEVVFAGSALETWRWLHNTGRWPAKTNGAVTPELKALVEPWDPQRPLCRLRIAVQRSPASQRHRCTSTKGVVRETG